MEFHESWYIIYIQSIAFWCNMGKKRKNLIKRVFNNDGLMAPYLSAIGGEPFITPASSAISEHSTEIAISDDDDLADVLESLNTTGSTIKYLRDSSRAVQFKADMAIPVDIYNSMSDEDLARYHLAYEKMLIENPGANPQRKRVLNADFAEEMQAHMYQKAKDDLQAELSSGMLDPAVQARAEELQTLILSYEGAWFGYYRKRSDLLTGLLATLNYAKANDVNAEDKLVSLPQEMQDITAYNAEMQQIVTSSTSNYQPHIIANSIVDRVQWGAYPGFRIPMPERIEALKAVRAIDNRDWAAYEALDQQKLSRFLPQLDEMKYFERKAALKAAVTNNSPYARLLAS